MASVETEEKKEESKQQFRKWQDVSKKWKPLMNIPNRPMGWGDDANKINKIRLEKIDLLLKALKQHKCDYYINEKDGGSVTFFPSPFLSKNDLGNKLLNKTSFIKSKQFSNIMKENNCNKLEYLFDFNCEVIDSPNDLHSFIIAAELAYFLHYPLRISPSHIWLMILHAVGIHVDKNAELLRNKFVTHQGKKELIVERDEFVKGSRNNDWSGVIKEFAAQIDKNTVNNTVPLLECDFSDTTPVMKISGKVAIMDMCKHYFEYTMRCGCGFPQITLSGNKKDWVKLRNKTSKLLSEKVDVKFGKNWLMALIPLIDRFIDAYDGKIDCLFWNSMVRRGATRPSFGAYGLDNIQQRERVYYSGWFNIFFPFMNPSISRWSRRNNNNNNNKQKEAEFQPNGLCCPYSDNDTYVKGG
eukprot:488622_1